MLHNNYNNQYHRCETSDKGANKLQSSTLNIWWRTYVPTHKAKHARRVGTPLMWSLSMHPCHRVCFWNGGGWKQRKWGGGKWRRRRAEGELTTCLASSKDICSLLISFSYCSFILSTSWSWAATSSFRAPFRAVSSLSRLFSTSSCSSLARRISCSSSFKCIISCWKVI